MKKNIPILEVAFALFAVLLILVLNLVDFATLPISFPETTILILSSLYVFVWMIFAWFAGFRRGKGGWYVILTVWIAIPSLLVLAMMILASFQPVAEMIQMIFDFFYTNVLRGFVDWTRFGFDLFEYFSAKGYPIVPAALCLLSYGVGRLFAKPQHSA